MILQLFLNWKKYNFHYQNNQQEIAQLYSKYNNDPIEKTSNLICYLASNDWYTGCLIQENEGIMISSGFLNGMDIVEAKEKIMDYMEEKGMGERTFNYHLRDWLISRQRYWGPPIPMIYCETCAKSGKGERKDLSGWYAEDENNLPVILPDIKDFKPKGDGVSPLSNAPDSWKHPDCPSCSAKATRELDVSDTFLDSAWYFLRYPSLGLSAVGDQASDNMKLKTDKPKTKARDLKTDKPEVAPWDRKIIQKWLPVNAYIGGAEHAVLHLLYARFVTMTLKDMGYLDFEEPFPFLFGHGLIVKDGAKMSKSKGNVINPDDYIAKFGADVLRCYLMFLGPYDAGGDFRDTGMEGMQRFLARVWDVIVNNGGVVLAEEDAVEVVVKTHKTVKKVTEDLSKFKYNTALSAIMEFVNLLREYRISDDGSLMSDLKVKNQKPKAGKFGCVEWNQALTVLTQLMAPFAPHVTEEIWTKTLDKKYSIHLSKWPTHNEKYLVENEATIVVQVNGKLRASFTVDKRKSLDKKLMFEMARKDNKVAQYLEGKRIKKEIYVSGKIVNFVV